MNQFHCKNGTNNNERNQDHIMVMMIIRDDAGNCA